MKKPRLTLAEAISKGSEYGPLVVAGECQLVTRALQAVDMLPPNPDDFRRYKPEQLRTLGYENDTLVRLYPWLKQRLFCPWCAARMDGTNIICHPFVEHVCQEETSLVEECQWLEEVEEVAEEQDPLISVAIFFRTEVERFRVLRAARQQGLTLNAFLAASVRMVVEHQLVLTEFACPEFAPDSGSEP